MRSYRVYTTANGLADMIITLGSPKHLDVAGDRAYVVVPASYTIKVHGKLVNKTNSIVTFALEKSATAWHISRLVVGGRLNERSPVGITPRRSDRFAAGAAPLRTASRATP